MANVRWNIKWALIGSVFFSAAQWLIITLVARRLGAYELGVLTYVMAIVSPVFALSNFNLKTVLATDVNNNYSFSEYFTLRFSLSILALFISFLFAYVLGQPLYVIIVVVIFAFVKFIESLSDICFGLYQKNESLKFSAVTLIVRSLLSVSIVALSTYMTESLIIVCVSMLVSYIVVFVFLDFRFIYRFISILKFNFSRDNLKRYKVLLWTVLPLGFTIFSNVFYQSIPRFFLESSYGLEEVGYYSAVMYFMMVGALVTNAVGQAVTPKLASHYDRSIKAFKSLTLKVFLFCCFLGLAGVIFMTNFGGKLLILIYTDEFGSKKNLLIIVMWVSLFMYISSCFGTALTAMQKFLCQGVVSMVILTIVFIFSYFLVPGYGAIGAAYSVLAAYIIKTLIVGLYYFLCINKSLVKDA